MYRKVLTLAALTLVVTLLSSSNATSAAGTNKALTLSSHTSSVTVINLTTLPEPKNSQLPGTAVESTGAKIVSTQRPEITVIESTSNQPVETSLGLVETKRTTAITIEPGATKVAPHTDIGLRSLTRLASSG